MLRRSDIRLLGVVALALASGGVLHQATATDCCRGNVQEEWVARYEGPGGGWDHAFDLGVDGSGNVYVTGRSEGSGTGNDYATIKYGPDGTEQWVARYDGPASGSDWAWALAIDGLDHVYVTGRSYGSSTGYDYTTIKYAPDGTERWVARYDGPSSSSDTAWDLAIDASDNVYVTGGSYGSGLRTDYATIKYRPDGTERWVARYDGPAGGGDQASALAVDASGNVYVTGQSEGADTDDDYATVKYGPDGSELWAARYDGPGSGHDNARDLAVDGAGNVYVTGGSCDPGGPDVTECDYVTIKYGPDGTELWVARYDGPGSEFDWPGELAVDGEGNVYVTGQADAGPPADSDFTTIKYSPEGGELWIARYDGPVSGSDQAYDIALDGYGNVYVTGRSGGSGAAPATDYATVKYGPDGTEQWVARYDGQGTIASYDTAVALALDATGGVYITGHSYGSGLRTDYATVKYSPGEPALTSTPTEPATQTATSTPTPTPTMTPTPTDCPPDVCSPTPTPTPTSTPCPPDVCTPTPTPTTTPTPGGANAIALDAVPGGGVDASRVVSGPAPFDVDVMIAAAPTGYAGYQYVMAWDPAVLAFDGQVHLEPTEAGFDLCSENYAPPDRSMAGCVKLGGTTTCTGPVNTVTMHCVSNGWSALHLVAQGEDTTYSKTLALGGVVIPTDLVDASITCQGTPTPTPMPTNTLMPTSTATPTATPTPPPAIRMQKDVTEDPNEIVNDANLWLCETGDCDGPGEGELVIYERVFNVANDPDGAGAYEFQLKFDHKLFDITIDNASWLSNGGTRSVQCDMTVITENWILFGCVSTGPVPGNTTDGILAYITVQPEPDLVNRIRPSNDNGVFDELLDENCEITDPLGHPLEVEGWCCDGIDNDGDTVIDEFGEGLAPGVLPGGMIEECSDFGVTIRILEGDLNLDCAVDVLDQQGSAFRYGATFGTTLYDDWYDLEPWVPDFDIDIKDLQKVFGRDGSTCQNPIPAQPPVPHP